MAILVFIFGLMIGSFLNCFILRLHNGKSMLGRSVCPKCKKQINWYDNIPILSFVILRGKCRFCKKKISWQYPVVELITGLLFTMAFLINFQFSIFNFQFLLIDFLRLFKSWFLISVMIIIFIYDLRWYLILDKIIIPSSIIIFILNLFLGFSWINLLISAIIGSSFFLIQFLISKGRWIGGGDIRMGALMGFALGWPYVILAIFLAYFIGSIVGIGLIVFKNKSWGSQVPLGVFLSVSTVIVMFFGDLILKSYYNLLF